MPSYKMCMRDVRLVNLDFCHGNKKTNIKSENQGKMKNDIIGREKTKKILANILKLSDTVQSVKHSTIRRGPMKRAVMFGVVVILVICLPAMASAQGIRPVQLSLFNPIQLFSEDTNVVGLRINLIYGVNQDVTGLDWGLINKVKGNATGLQYGLVNITDNNFLGWQDGLINMTEGTFTGLQTGFFNRTWDMHGIQFGAVNVADMLNGIQIGIININNSPNPFRVFPIVNWSF